MYRKNAEQLLCFIEKSPSCFHVIENMKKELTAGGFCELKESARWELVPGGAYFVTRNGSALIAFRLPEDVSFPAKSTVPAFQIIASHSDSPTFKIKENPEIAAEGCYVKLNTEKYGGMILSSWLDRPLSAAGRILLNCSGEGADGRNRRICLKSRLVNVDRDLVLIPNQAIHMNPDMNKGYSYNPQVDMLPLYGTAASGSDAKGGLLKQIAAEEGVDAEDIISADLFLYNRQKGSIWGAEEEFISSGKLDDLECTYASLRGILAAEGGSENICVHCVLDNEEVGSGTKQGAAGTFLKDTLQRIIMALGGSSEDYLRAVAASFLISADNAHAVHPNRSDKADPVNRPHMNEGIVIKYSGSQKYTSDAVSAALLKTICEKAGVPVQTYTNRSDAAGGSTLGNISTSKVSVTSVDIGLAQLAMHSAYETAGVKDISYLIQLAETFFSTTVRMDEDIILKQPDFR